MKFPSALMFAIATTFPLLAEAQVACGLSAASRLRAPPYPTLLMRQCLNGGECIGGDVSFRFAIGADGRVREVVILSSPHPDLSLATEKTVMNYWYAKPCTELKDQATEWYSSRVSFERPL